MRAGGKTQSKLVRYADDIVILCARDTTQAYEKLQKILTKLELQLNEEKTQISVTATQNP